jgi:hypothetical protein
VELPALLPADAKARSFWACATAVLLLVALYTTWAVTAWSVTPLGQRPQGEADAYLANAEKLFQGDLPREPFFRTPAYLAVLATLRGLGVPAARLAGAARVLNAVAHVAITALVLGLALRFWRRKGALLAAVLWGFYPPALFLVLQPGPATLALLVWLIGAAAALGTVWQSPIWQGGRRTNRHTWAYPFAAGVAFALAAALYAPLWPVALAWPGVALFLGRDLRVRRLLAALLGAGLVAAGVVGFQMVWGGSPQPLAGEDLYRLARSLEITQSWNAPLPTVEFSPGEPGTDYLEFEARLSYQFQTKLPIPGHAVLAGYWWRAAAHALMYSPPRSALRAARKTSQFFALPNYSAGADFARGRAEITILKYNPLNWGLLLVLGSLGLALGWRSPAVGLAVLLAALVVVGGVAWYPTMETRAPVAVLLAVFAGALPGAPLLWWRNSKLLLGAALLVAGLLAWWPRRNSPADALTARDSRERALAWAGLGRYNDALNELTRPGRVLPLTFFEKEMAAGWRFQELLDHLPAVPSTAQLEKQLLDNGDLARQSVSSQFRCGACLWLLTRTDGALYYWDNLANDQGAWGAAARTAIASSGLENPAQAQRRAAWEIGGSPQPDAALAPFFAFMRAQAAKPAAPKN